MATYRISGVTSQNGVPTSNLVIVYKADRDDMATYGQEIGRVTASLSGVWELEFDDWSKEVLVVNLDMTPDVKYEAAAKDWVIPTIVSGGQFPVELDPYFDDVIMLMHFDGGNGDTTTIDEIGNPITIEGSGELSSTAKLFGTTSFHAAEPNGFVKFPTDQLITDKFGVGDWTLEFQLYLPTSGVAASDRLFQLADGDVVNALYLGMVTSTQMQFGVKRAGVGWDLSPAYNMTTNAWNYVVIEKFGDTVYASIDGVNQWTYLFDYDLDVQPSQFAVIGAQTSGRAISGYFEEFRMTTRSRYRGVAPTLQDAVWPDSRFQTGLEATILDPFWYDVYSLLHLDELGTTIVDDGPYPVPWTVQNQAQIVADAEAFGGASLYLDGTADGIILDSGNASALNWIHDGSGATFECRFKHDGTMQNSTLLANNILSSNEVGVWFGIYSNGSLRLAIVRGVSGQIPIDITTATGLITADTYHSIAFTVGDNRADIWVDGVNVGGQVASYPWSTADATYNALLGHFTGGWDSIGWFDEVRFTKAVRYTANYTPQTAAFPNWAFDPEEDVGQINPIELDPYFNHVITRVHFDNGDSSTLITDETGNLSWTTVNQAQQSITEFEYGGSSLLLDGTGDYITAGVASDWTWLHDGTTDYTLEISFRASANSNDTLFDTGGGPSSDHGIYCRLNSAGSISFTMAGGHGSGNYTVSVGTATGLITALQWHKLAIVVTGGVSAEIFLDGSSVGTAVNGFANSATVSSIPMRIGYYQSAGGYDFGGYLDELRITERARYQGVYTPATEEFPDTRFLPGYEATILDPYFEYVEVLIHGGQADLSTTVVETIQKHAVSDIGTGVVYTTFAGGFSDTVLDFAAGGISVQTAIPLGSAFTIEARIYPDGWSGDQYLFDNRTTTDTQVTLYVNSGGLLGLTIAGSTTTYPAPVAGAWHDLQLNYDGTDFRVLVDGLVVATVTSAGLTFTDSKFSVGCYAPVPQLYFNGKMEEIRLTANVARNTTTYTPTTELFPNFEWDPDEVLLIGDFVTPVEVDPYFDKVIFLCNPEGVQGDTTLWDSIKCEPSSNTNDGAHLDNVDPIFGNVSAKFDGSFDYIDFPDSPDWDFGSDDFCVEGWVKADVGASGYDTWLGRWETSGSIAWTMGVDFGTGVGQFGYSTNGSFQAGNKAESPASTFLVDVWHHVAGVRHGNNLDLYVDGISVATKDVTGVVIADVATPLRIGGQAANSQYFPGRVGPMRITRGHPRYTSDFVVPTAAFPDTRFERYKEPDPLDQYYYDIGFHSRFDNDSFSDEESRLLPVLTGTAEVSSSQSKFGTSSLFCPAATYSCLQIANTDWAGIGGTDDFTIELWYYPTGSHDSFGRIFCVEDGDFHHGLGFGHHTTAGWLELNLSQNGTSWLYNLAFDASLVNAQWHHIVCERSENVIQMYINGVSKLTTAVLPDLHFDTAVNSVVGGQTGAPVRSCAGYINDFRVTPGVARYKGNVPVPTGFYPDSYFNPSEQIATVPKVTAAYQDNTVMLVTGSGVDGDTGANDLSARSKAPTFYGTTSISSAQSKYYGTSIHCPDNNWFEIPAEYGVLHLCSDLVTPSHTAYGVRDFVFETWVLIPDISAGYHYLISHGNPGGGGSQSVVNRRGGLVVFVDNVGKMNLTAGNLNRDGSTRYYAWVSDDVVPEGEWCHLKWVVEDGTWIPFINGVESTISFLSGSYTNSEINRCAVYQEQTMAFNGYAVENGTTLAGASSIIYCPEIFFQDMRLTFGKRPADNSLVVPKSLSLTTDSYGLESEDPHWDNVVLLVKAQEETGSTTFSDSSSLNNSVVVTGAVSAGKDGKFGRSINKTGGTINDYVSIADQDFYQTFQDSGTTWTIEFWYKTPNVTTYDSGAFYWVTSEVPDSGIWVLQVYAGGTYDSSKLQLFMMDSGGRKINFGATTDSLVADTWHHYAIVRENNTVKTFLDGKLQSTYPYTWEVTLGGGSGLGVRLNSAWNVYITPNETDNVRLTANVARYKSDFDKPTKPFPTQGRLNPLAPTPLALLRDDYDFVIDPCDNKVVSSLNFSGGIRDSKSQAWTTSGAVYSTGLPKLSFYGTGGYLQQTPDADFDDDFDGTNSSNWTIEFTYQTDDYESEHILLDWRPDNTEKGIVVSYAPITTEDPYNSFVQSAIDFESGYVDRVGNVVWTVNTNASLTSTSIYGGQSLLVAATDGGIECVPTAAMKPGTGDFCVELSINGTSTTGTRTVFDTDYGASNIGFAIISLGGQQTLTVWQNSSTRITGTAAVYDGNDHDIRYVRVGGVGYLFVDGVQDGSSWADTTDYTYTEMHIGGYFFDTTANANATIDEFRLTIGHAREGASPYTPSLPFPAGYDHTVYVGIGDSTAGYNIRLAAPVLSPSREVDVALTRDGNDYLLHVGGEYFSKGTTAATPDLGALGVRFGADRSATVGTSFNGHLLRTKFTEGVSRYSTESYFPETIAEPAVAVDLSSTLSLLHFEGADGATETFDDISGVEWDFVSTAEISTTSAKFGNSSLSVPLAIGSYIQSFDIPSFGLSDFTIECWVKIPMNASSVILFDFRTTNSFDPVGLTAYWSANVGYLELWRAGAVAAATSNVRDDTWHHIAIVRTAGFLSLYQDGVQEGTPYADTYDYAVGVNGWIWGAQTATIGTAPLGGLIDEARISSEAKYLANFTPEGKPFKGKPYYYERDYPYLASLMHFEGTNADQFTTDVVSENSWEFTAGAVISSSKVKFGSTSLLVPAGSNYIRSFDMPDFAIHDFTIECWMNLDTDSAQQSLFDWRETGADAAGGHIFINNNQTTLNFYTGGAIRITGTTTVEDSSWHHVALVRASGVTKLYVDGVQDGADYVDANDYVIGTKGFVWGAASDSLGNLPLLGHLDDCRITIGEARYLGNFNLPLEHPDTETFKDYNLGFVDAD